MDIQVSRRLLARAGEERVLSTEAIRIALDLSGLRPGASETRDFAVRVMKFAGVISLATGIIFLVAFNWQQLGLYGRFAVVEIPLLLALAAAWVKGTERLSGRLALILAVLLTGALLALFGQTYQTGADVYELFLGWTVLALPWIIACRYAPAWALWILLVNLAALLFAFAAGQQPSLFWLFASRRGLTVWTVPLLLNIAAYCALEVLRERKAWGFGERWLTRGTVAIAMAFGTLVAIIAIVEFRASSTFDNAVPALLFIAASAGLGGYAYKRREDLFVFAVLALAWVVTTTTLLGKILFQHEPNAVTLFLIAIYVIGASSAAVAGISRIGSAWKSRGSAT